MARPLLSLFLTTARHAAQILGLPAAPAPVSLPALNGARRACARLLHSDKAPAGWSSVDAAFKKVGAAHEALKLALGGGANVWEAVSPARQNAQA